MNRDGGNGSTTGPAGVGARNVGARSTAPPVQPRPGDGSIVNMASGGTQ